MRGAIRSLPNTPLWCGAQLKAHGQLYLVVTSVLFAKFVLWNGDLFP